MKLPLQNADSIEWLNDFQSVKTRKPSDTECQDFNIIRTRVESWITTPDSLDIFKFCDIASLNAPQWTTDQLITGGLSANDATHTALLIMTKIRLTLVDNWQSRHIAQTENKVFPTPLYNITPPRVSTIWGKGTPGSINKKKLPSKPPPNTQSIQQQTTRIRLHQSRPALNFLNKDGKGRQKFQIPLKKPHNNNNNCQRKISRYPGNQIQADTRISPATNCNVCPLLNNTSLTHMDSWPPMPNSTLCKL